MSVLSQECKASLWYAKDISGFKQCRRSLSWRVLDVTLVSMGVFVHATSVITFQGIADFWCILQGLEPSLKHSSVLPSILEIAVPKNDEIDLGTLPYSVNPTFRAT